MSAHAQQSEPTPAPGSTKIVLSDADLARVAKIMDADAGIYIDDEKISLVHSRLIKRLRVLQLSSFSDYCDLIESANGKSERQEMLLSLTTNVTRFFREPHHFEHLIQSSLPPLIARAKAGKRIRIWSAGCSNGQEPYSIAAVVLSLLPDAHKYDIKILASDIDTKMVMEGRRGIYDARLMQKMPEKLRAKHFDVQDGPRGQVFCANAHMKSLLSFRKLNLNADTWPMKNKFDIIFCRNTVIYFDEPTQARIWTRFKNQLNGHGYLYIGHSERLSGPDENKFEKAAVTTYKLER